MSYENIPKNAAGTAVLVEQLKVVETTTQDLPKDFYTEVAKGNIPGHSIVSVRGRNADVDVNLPAHLWNGGDRLIYKL